MFKPARNGEEVKSAPIIAQPLITKSLQTMANNWLQSLDTADATSGLDATHTTTITPLAHLGLIAVRGDDAASFLHNLLTNDVTGLGANDVRRAGFCTPKGRMLADFLVWRDVDGVILQLSADLLPPLLKKLSMYVLRAKAKLSDASESMARIGLAGPQAHALLAQQGLPQPTPLQQQAFDGGTVIGLDAQRFEIVIAADKVAALWSALRAGGAQPAGIDTWHSLDVAAGIPLITAATSEEFIPQMVNFELIGGVGFKKGCYPGQEIVARTQYLGKIKRRMYRAHVDGTAAAAGTQVYSTETGDQSCGMVVTSAAVPGGFDLLLVAQSSAAATGELCLGAPPGAPNSAALRLLTLPYAVDAADGSK